MSAQYPGRMQDQTEFESDSVEVSGDFCSTESCSSVKNAVRSYPMTSILTMFGIGLGAGALLGCYMMSNRESEQLKAAESFAARMRQSMSGAVPESVKQYFRG